MTREERIYTVLALGVAVLGCIAAWAVIPQIQQFIFPDPTATPTSTATDIPALDISTSVDDEWVICWHGTRFGAEIDQDTGEEIGNEVLVAYPIERARVGIELAESLWADWAGEAGPWLNDSLKICQVHGVWYGDGYDEWFPQVSYLQLDSDRLIICEHIPKCAGQRWEMSPTNIVPPTMQVRQPEGSEIQVIGYIRTDRLE